MRRPGGRLPSHCGRSRPYKAVVQTKAERRENDAVQTCHWATLLLKRWLLGTHAGAVSDKHLQAYLDEFAFRHNRQDRSVGDGLPSSLSGVSATMVPRTGTSAGFNRPTAA